MKFRLTFLGTGTSVGVPMPGCECEGCTSVDPRDQRWRASALVQWDTGAAVIDTSPEFRLQMLRAGVKRLDAILFTHNHADHVHGLDDVRAFNFVQKRPMPIYGSPAMLAWLREHFSYIWKPLQVGGGLPWLELRSAIAAFEIHGLRVTPLPALHGRLRVLGYRFGDLAYFADVSEIPAETLPLLQGLRTLILDATRYSPHSTHFHVAAAIDAARNIGAQQVFFTHLNHDIIYARLAAELPPGMAPAYDGLTIEGED